MNKFFLVTTMAALTIGSVNAQVENLALKFSSNGTVDCGAMPDLDGLSSYSLQFWLNPDSWTEGASLMSRGEDFFVKLGSSGNLNFVNGDNIMTVSNNTLKVGEWNQVTMICEDGKAIVLINGEQSGDGNLSNLSKSKDAFVLGGGYTGLLDEVRVWNDALNDTMALFDYFTNNTLNKWNPMWDNLVAYYKMDQKNCRYLVDYKGIEDPVKDYDNHGIISEGVTKVSADNEKMPYLVNAAYTANERFYDRLIPKDQYLLSNEIIILGADCVPSTGGIKLRTPNNHATLSGVKYLSSFEGRDGVVEFEGKFESKLVLPVSALLPSNAYTFETWLYLEEWTPGAYLFRKESEDKTKGIAVLLGEDKDNPTIKVRINGGTYQSFKLAIPVKTWFHIAIEPTVQPSGVAQAFNFYINGESKTVDKSTSENVSADNVPQSNEEEPLYIGEGIKGKMDETCIWNKVWGASNIKSQMTNIPVPSLTKNVNVSDMQSAIAYFRYDDPDNPGFSYHSQDNWANIIRSAYDGYNCGNIVLSVNGSNGNANDFYAIINDESKRKAFAQNLAELAKNYDGVELDLEWCYNASGTNSWANYALMADEIIKVLPEEKTFRISMHNVTYNYPVNKVDNITGFTIQQYGPQNAHWTYNSFKNYLSAMKNYGLPADKLMTSYATTTSRGFVNGTASSPIKGVKDGFLDDYVPSLDEPEGELMTKDFNGYTYSYMSPVQVYKRAKYTRQNGYQGIFYWDMGNDLWNGTPENPEPHPYNISKYCSYGLNANNDKIVTELNVNHYGESNSIKKVEKEAGSIKVFVSPSPAENVINVSLSNGRIPEKVLIYSLSGALMNESKKTNIIDVNKLNTGVYMVTAIDEKGIRYNSKFIKR